MSELELLNEDMLRQVVGVDEIGQAYAELSMGRPVQRQFHLDGMITASWTFQPGAPRMSAQIQVRPVDELRTDRLAQHHIGQHIQRLWVHPGSLLKNRGLTRQLAGADCVGLRGQGSRLKPGYFLFIQDIIMIPLLGQEHLPVSGKILVAGIAGHDGVKVSQQPVALWT